MTIYGPSWPLSNGERDFFKMNTTLLDQIKFEMKNLILTSPGENLSDPTYGVGLRSYLFEMNNPDVITNITSNIRIQMATYLPGVGVESINAIRDATNIDSGLLGIKISFRAPRTNNLETIDISLYGSEQEIY